MEIKPLTIMVGPSASASLPGMEPSWNLVDLPEAGLYPSMHGEIADRVLLDVSAGRKCLIRTHSEMFLLRVRRRVAEGQLASEDVIIYWCEGNSRLPIHVTPRGNLSGEHTTMFEEVYEEVLLLRKAAKART